MMDDDRFEDVLRGLPRSFNPPPDAPLDEMWATIEDAHFNAPLPIARPRSLMTRTPWLAAAAALVIGIGIGRHVPFSAKGTIAHPAAGASNPPSTPADTSAPAAPY